jgi:hypothetical protein
VCAACGREDRAGSEACAVCGGELLSEDVASYTAERKSLEQNGLARDKRSDGSWAESGLTVRWLGRQGYALMTDDNDRMRLVEWVSGGYVEATNRLIELSRKSA